MHEGYRGVCPKEPKIGNIKQDMALFCRYRIWQSEKRDYEGGGQNHHEPVLSGYEGTSQLMGRKAPSRRNPKGQRSYDHLKEGV